MERDNRELYRQIARRYAQAWGEEILAEQASAESTPTLDRKVRRNVNRGRFRLVTRVAATLAACVALALLLPQFLQTGLDQAPASDGAAWEDAGEEDAGEAAEAPADAASGDYGEEGEMGAGTPTPEPLPIRFSLPENLSVSGVELDQGQTIYHLSDFWQDDVVMTMEPADTGEIPGGLVELTINDSAAWGFSTPDYQYLAFRQDDIVYTLTCRHDINTLVDLGRHIL